MRPRRSLKERLVERLPPSLKFRLKCAVADARHRFGRLTGRVNSGTQTPEHHASDPRLAAHAADGRNGPFILVVDDSVPRPDRDAGSARMAFILRALSEWSRPVFVYLSKNEWPEYEKPLWQAGVETERAVHLRRL